MKIEIQPDENPERLADVRVYIDETLCGTFNQAPFILSCNSNKGAFGSKIKIEKDAPVSG